MIDFACKRFDVEEVIKCALGLSKAEMKLLRCLKTKHPKWYTTDELATDLMLDLSTVQRGTKKLHEKRIIERSQTNLRGGGYVFHYQISPKKKRYEIILDIVEHWKDHVASDLEKW